MHPFGRFDATVTDMGVTAVRAALAEAGNPAFQAAFCATAYGGVASGHKVLGALALTGVPIVDVEAGCASGGAALMLAAGAIRAGQYDTVLVFGIEKMPKGIIRSSFFEPWREEAGLAATPAYFALRAQRLMRESGVTKEHLARVVVKNRRNGVENPNAMFRKETTVEDVLASRVVCEPLHLYMLCSPNEGAAAVVLRRGDLAAPDDVTLAAAVLRSHLPGSVLGEATPMSGIDDDDIPPPSTLAATRVRGSRREPDRPRRRRVPGHRRGPRAALVRGARPVRARRSGAPARRRDDGPRRRAARQPERRPALEGRATGASALAQVIELATQLHGRAGARQVDGATVAPRAHRRPRRERVGHDPDALSPDALVVVLDRGVGLLLRCLQCGLR